MTIYSSNNLPVICCWRCGYEADVEWVEITSFGDVDDWCVPARMLCMTPGCVDENGSNATSAEPPTPEQIQARAERALARLREVWP